MDANGFVSQWLAEDDAQAAARARAADIGLSAVTPALGSMLRYLAASVEAKAVVETGTGTGVTGLWILAGMRPDGILTSIDIEPEHQRLARSSFGEAGIPSSRARLITGQALEVLPRLADHGYDMVVIDAAATEYAAQLQAAWRLLRPGGIAAVVGLLRGGRAPDASARDDETTALRAFLDDLRADERLTPALVPLGDGLLVVRAPV